MDTKQLGVALRQWQSKLPTCGSNLRNIREHIATIRLAIEAGGTGDRCIGSGMHRDLSLQGTSGGGLNMSRCWYCRRWLADAGRRIPPHFESAPASAPDCALCHEHMLVA